MYVKIKVKPLNNKLPLEKTFINKSFIILY